MLGRRVGLPARRFLFNARGILKLGIAARQYGQFTIDELLYGSFFFKDVPLFAKILLYERVSVDFDRKNLSNIYYTWGWIMKRVGTDWLSPNLAEFCLYETFVTCV